SSESTQRRGLPEGGKRTRQPVSACQAQELGIRLSPGGLVQAVTRIGERCRSTYEALVEVVRRTPGGTGDETGWHVNGDPGWLWITTELVLVYGIREGRGYDEAASCWARTSEACWSATAGDLPEVRGGRAPDRPAASIFIEMLDLRLVSSAR